MSLDAYVRCTCIREGKVKKAHPLPGRLVWDESNAPALSGDATTERTPATGFPASNLRRCCGK